MLAGAFVFMRLAAVAGEKRLVEVRTPVTEETPGRTRLRHCFKIEARGYDALFIPAQLGDDLARRAGDERGAVESQLARLAALDADAICGNQRKEVRRRVALHRAPPMVA